LRQGGWHAECQSHTAFVHSSDDTLITEDAL
jgi:hypothetical protein